MALLPTITGPRDLDRLSPEQLTELASEIRTFLIENVARTGGHLGPNLGVVELTIAMHRVFRSPDDPFIFDTGHQSYVHKILTGRQDFSGLRSRDGLAGYPQRSESPHDVVESSHASSSLSWADGISRALSRTGRRDHHVVAVVGDGSLTGGMTWEALNNISDDNDRNLVIIVNDNGRSYAPTIGGMARYLNRVRAAGAYRTLRTSSDSLFRALGPWARAVYRGVRGGTHGFLSRFVNNESLYSNLDIKYFGPIDGHDIPTLLETLELAKRYQAPVIVHVITEKGRGYAPALEDEADQFHAVGKIDPATGETLGSGGGTAWTSVFADELVTVGEQRPDVIAVTAAMLRPTGLKPFADRFPGRVYDVGIAEQHAVASAAGLAYGGLHPVVAIYATFMNRAFDQVMMDVALHRAGVTFVLDRAGVTGPDGPSHHGIWDLAMLQIVPGIRIAAPRDAARLRELLHEAVAVEDAPTVVRFPRGNVGDELPAIERRSDGTDVLARNDQQDVLIVGIGPMAQVAVDVAHRLHSQGIGATVIDPRWAVPVAPSVVELAAQHRIVITIEDGIRVGGVGTRIRQVLREAGIDTAVDELGVPDEFISHASREQILEDAGLVAPKIAHDVVAQVLGTRVPKARASEDAGEWTAADAAPEDAGRRADD
ncbi:MAG: 1-deoxy-D-xylulose-5-phosphate synthase [Microbacterium ginsengisoli]|uniref:1-deoxy-D-xylulose-5-phosphate synthase n=1 Tax=Microbacterium TaxID=33882 RepID=UPI0006FD4E9F|nr:MULTISPECIES: 1-deoxy-D-xylulose-5-phosphate synthase [unclassified Microbacterium]MBN9197390.1 1-deoxy-D-xylulose-5-phosphate synthase [Microbacterium ginsengisoli]KQR93089.1 1-deoxy-D-xylulose-5-phosphate synthase [Microbacterium sp. Leaf351]KQS05528.1 1-deoxy-D-xylulose-5-phosphate synthase [Microbacterium sp. Leaf347]ODU78407.1 MAG: 1-deoxy-D-xylulose-5-phosphate synthase [Microbacterium sp. SCN 71-21]OJU77306.1 MAG: 1-deoxy-D-xylulose-5-phosphate synthase [Microbacterium sp. 71-23]